MTPTVQPTSGRKPPAGFQAELGHRAPERLAVEYKRRFDVHDLDGVRDLHAEGFVMVDHREHNSRDAEEEWRPEYGASDVRIELEEVLACDERVIAMRATVRGTSPDGQPFEVPLRLVDVIEDGLFVSADRYDAENRDAMLARYTELGGSQCPWRRRTSSRAGRCDAAALLGSRRSEPLLHRVRRRRHARLRIGAVRRAARGMIARCRGPASLVSRSRSSRGAMTAWRAGIAPPRSRSCCRTGSAKRRCGDLS